MAQYQIVVLDPEKSDRGKRLRDTLRTRLNELGVPIDEAVAFLDETTVNRRDLRAPIVGVYFGSGKTSLPLERAANELVSSSSVVIPAVEDLARLRQLVPKSLHEINGLKLEAADRGFERLAGTVLEALQLLRPSRRIFISYRRIESRSVAIQLYEALDERGFDAFLDTHSVPPGEPFQDVLWHRLSDTDVMVLLDSPGFLSSRWTREELANASAISVGILQLVWPSHNAIPTTDLCTRRYLKPSDFDPAFDPASTRNQLKMDVAREISADVEALRARSVASRHENLVREFCQAANALGLPASVQRKRYILTRKKDRTIAIIPTVGVPDAVRYQEVADQIANEGVSTPDEAYLIYDHRGIRDRWFTHLNWLDLHLPTKSLRIIDAGKWLQKP